MAERNLQAEFEYRTRKSILAELKKNKANSVLFHEKTWQEGFVYENPQKKYGNPITNGVIWEVKDVELNMPTDQQPTSVHLDEVSVENHGSKIIQVKEMRFENERKVTSSYETHVTRTLKIGAAVKFQSQFSERASKQK